jgi:hypothetical protein
MCGAPGNRATQMSLTLTLSRQRERELGREGESERAVDQILCAVIVFDLGLVDSVCRLGWEVVRWMLFRGPALVRNGLTLD